MMRIGFGAALLLAAGCGAEPTTATMTDQALTGAANLPSCGEVAVPSGQVAVEDRGDQVIVWTGVGQSARALCAGAPGEVFGSGVLDGTPHRLSPFDNGDPAASDPMPADGRLDPAASDPMPADGRLDPAASDPMPADGRHTVAALPPTSRLYSK